ncbi:MAG: hypothetical protein NT105_15825 [Verrucomicrobia bacterium]|nr:hypothetical protein [Verrucomicrobiota bacterium]
MKKLWTVVGLSLIAAVVMVVSASAAEKGKDGEKRKGPPTCSGKIVSVSSDCIVVKNRNGEQKFAVSPTTIFGTKKDPKKCEDFKEGDAVVVSFKEDGDKKCALSVRVAPPAKKKEVKK